MSARLLLFTLILLCSFLSRAQESYFGIKTGFTRASLLSDGERPESLDSRFGFSGAMVFSTKIPNVPIGFSMEPGYVLKGNKSDQDTLDYKLNYISIPFLLDFYPIKRAKLSVGLEPGLITNTQNISEGEDRETLKRKWEVSALASASVSLTFFMDIGVRYHLGLTDIIDRDENLGLENVRTEYLQAFLLFKIAN